MRSETFSKKLYFLFMTKQSTNQQIDQPTNQRTDKHSKVKDFFSIFLTIETLFLREWFIFMLAVMLKQKTMGDRA